jgi:AcrR family transcriptional regulator
MSDAQKLSRAGNVTKFKRQHILSAARRVFDAKGMAGLNMRAIAEEAGYSLGAAYSYFRTKEEIEAELLAGILGELTRQIKTASSQRAANDGNQPFSVFTAYFRDRPEARKLLLLTLGALGEKSPDIPATTQKELNSRLLTLMGLMANGLHQATRTSAPRAQEETTDFIAYLLGLLLLENSDRLQLLNQDSQEMVDRYGERMLLRSTQQEE